MKRVVPEAEESAEAQIPATYEHIPAPITPIQSNSEAVRLQVVN
jgi:hypothetical protein